MPDTSQAVCQFTKIAEIRRFRLRQGFCAINVALMIGKFCQLLGSTNCRLAVVVLRG
jgi:hypothetical protein